MGDNDKLKMDATIVNSITLGQCWGVTDRRVRQLREESVISEVARGKFDLYQCTRKYCEYLRQQINASDESNTAKLDYDQEHAAHEKIKREKAELQLKVMRSELHFAKDVQDIMTDMIVRSKVKILGLPQKVADKLVGKDANVINNILEKHIMDALNELSDYTPELFKNDEVIEDDTE